MGKRDDRLRNALDNITKRQLINDTNNLKRIMILKKLNHDLPLVRAKYFFQKIRKNADTKTIN